MNNLFLIEVMFYGKLLYLLIYIYIYIYIIAVNPKWYIDIDRYRNISFYWLNLYSLQYEIDFLDHSTCQVNNYQKN